MSDQERLVGALLARCEIDWEALGRFFANNYPAEFVVALNITNPATTLTHITDYMTVVKEKGRPSAIRKYRLDHPGLTLREAIDVIDAAIGRTGTVPNCLTHNLPEVPDD